MANASSSGSGGITLRGLLGVIVVVDIALSVLGATVNSLDLYLGGTALDASPAATTGAAILGWLFQVIFFALVQGGIMVIGGIVLAVVIGIFSKQLGDNIFASIVKWNVRVALPLSILAGAYNGFVHYGALSILHADPTLNLVASILAGVLTFIYLGLGFGAFLTVAIVVLSVIANALKKVDQADAGQTK
jgi:hypothetical protein